jgi:hypothetical protein
MASNFRVEERARAAGVGMAIALLLTMSSLYLYQRHSGKLGAAEVKEQSVLRLEATNLGRRVPTAKPKPKVAARPRHRVARARPARPPVFKGRGGARVSVARIQRFLRSRGSPMAPHARRIVLAGVRWHVDPRSVVAIAGVESSYGVHAPGHNAWGWGGGKGGARWSSWGRAIDRFTAGLARGYPSMAKGMFWRGAKRYSSPRTGAHWARKATSIFRSI